MLADFHLHSEFSDDSITPMEKQIERASVCNYFLWFDRNCKM
jgi:histidinol phosphatase-like PHP family hydrolase